MSQSLRKVNLRYSYMNLEKPYIISVYAAIRNDKGEFLLLKRSEDSTSNPGKWDLPGGKLEREEILEAAVVREVWEETEITIVPGEIAGYVAFELPEKRVIAIIYDGGYIVSDVKLSHEHTEYSWMPLGEILGMQTLPRYFRDSFRRFTTENREPSESPI
jgi:8-oxo-dGTP diphosphatase